MNIGIRPIEKKDNQNVAGLIRSVLREFKIDRPGTVYFDPATDHLFELFETPESVYWVLEENGKITGGCGIFPTQGLPEGCVELVKFYVSPESRGKGYGKKLMNRCFDSAIDFGFHQIYLESLHELENAVGIYENAGFRRLPKPLGNSGHHACSVWMLKDL
jgi:putative acetyltransferase